MPRHSHNPQRGVTWDTFALPIQAGVDLQSNDKARPVARLSRLVNGSFAERNSVAKRPGHTGARVRTDDPYFPVEATSGSRWIYGAGYCDPEFPADPPVGPVQRQLRGAACRDEQEVVWTGDRLLTYDHDRDTWKPGTADDSFWAQNDVPGGLGTPFYAPQGPVETLDTLGTSDGTRHTCARGRRYNLVAYNLGGIIYARVENFEGAVVVPDRIVSTGAPAGGGGTVTSSSCTNPRAMWLDEHLAVVFRNGGGNDIMMAHAPEDDPGSWFLEPLSDGSTATLQFDAFKITDSLGIVAYRSAANIRLLYFDRGGATPSPAPETSYTTTQAATGHVALSVHPYTRQIGLVWATAIDTHAAVLAADFSELMDISLFDTPGIRVSCAARALNTTPVVFVGLADEGTHGAGSEFVRVGAFDSITGVLPESRDYRHLRLAGAAFGVGNEVFWTARTATIGTVPQRSYVLMGGVTSAVVSGAWARGTADIFDTGSPDAPFTADYDPDQDLANRTRWTLSFAHTPRFTVKLDAPPTSSLVFSERRGLRATLDFLPPFRTAQLGRSLYAAGALVWAWDGATALEAGFLQWPEYTAAPSQGAAGLIQAGTYRYRVYYCRRNRFGEITRSPAITSSPVTIVDNKQITFTLAITPATNNLDNYFEVYRNLGETNGNTYHLISGFDAATATSATRFGETAVYTDNQTDTAIENNPVDTHNPNPGAPVELEETAPPGCEIVAQVEDRLWFAGGTLPHGVAAYTKHHEPGETAAWNDEGVLLYSPDSRNVALTGITSVSGAIVLFRRDEVMAFTGDGPDNTGQGTYSLVKRLSSDLGALSPEGLSRAPDGAVFWSAEGPRVVTEQFAVAAIGDEVAPVSLVSQPIATVVVPRNSQIRWYLDNGRSVAYDYVTRQWSEANNLRAAHATFSPRVDGDFLVRADGIAMFEDPGVHQDAGHPYEFTFRTAELRPGEIMQGSNLARRWAVTGEWRGEHSLTYRVRINGGPLVVDDGTWNVLADLGDYVVPPDGDPPETILPDTTLPSPDGVWRATRRFARQRCGSLNVEFSDGAAHGDSFVASELSLELGVKDGLTKIPARTF